MNPITVVTQLSKLPEGVALENLRQRVTVMLALAVAITVPMPSSPIVENSLRSYFQENVAGIRNTLFQINEAQPFDVERTTEVAYQLWARRYGIAFNTVSSDLLQLRPFSPVLDKLIPELDGLSISDVEVREAAALVRQEPAV